MIGFDDWAHDTSMKLTWGLETSIEGWPHGVNSMESNATISVKPFCANFVLDFLKKKSISFLLENPNPSVIPGFLKSLAILTCLGSILQSSLLTASVLEEAGIPSDYQLIDNYDIDIGKKEDDYSCYIRFRVKHQTRGVQFTIKTSAASITLTCEPTPTQKDQTASWFDINWDMLGTETGWQIHSEGIGGLQRVIVQDADPAGIHHVTHEMLLCITGRR